MGFVARDWHLEKLPLKDKLEPSQHFVEGGGQLGNFV